MVDGGEGGEEGGEEEGQGDEAKGGDGGDLAVLDGVLIVEVEGRGGEWRCGSGRPS